MPIIPSIDLIGGHAVQLVGGKVEALKVDAGDPIPIAKRFRLAGDVAVVDLDAALGKGDNKDVILQLLKVAPCRVGGGIRSVDSALFWLNAGASRVVLGTAATPEILSQLPKQRVVAALDCLHGEVVVKGWTSKTGVSVFDRMRELKGMVGGFLVTFVEKEGRMEGFDIELVKQLKAICGDDVSLTIAGGVTTVEDVAALDKLGCEAQVGMALYTNRMDLGLAIAAPLVSDRPDGLFPTIVADEQNGVLGLVYSDRESIQEAVRTLKGVYKSRSRGLWFKGASSGDTQDLLRIELDCDRDALVFIVHQNGKGFCHRGVRRCFGDGVHRGLGALMATLLDRKANPVAGSYTNRLFNDPELLRSKLLEEAKELLEASTPDEVAWEAADVVYFALTCAAKAGVSLDDIERHLDLRALRVTRRKGDAKPDATAASATQQPAQTGSAPSAAPVPPADASAPLLKRLTPEQVQSIDFEPVDASVVATVQSIVSDVKARGEAAFVAHAVRLGDIKEGERYLLRREQLQAVFDSLPLEQQNVLRRTADRIRVFAQAQRNSVTDLVVAVEGGKAGHDVVPVERAGCYAPGGRYPLPSSVLMTAITARVAGVKSVYVASPRPAPVTIAAAYVAGADALICVGGPQVIAALAYGAGEIPPVDCIVGPGNKYVTAAKQLVNGVVKIDMLAGPSECLVIADETAHADIVAADLLAQAEHDPDARPLLISIAGAGLVDRVQEELRRQLALLPTRDVAAQALKNGYVVMVKDIAEAVAVSDKIAAEHLELHVAQPQQLQRLVHNYGGLFVGTLSGEVLGDYGAGPNHVLPTGATARYSGGLSVFTFLRIRTWLDMDSVDRCQRLVEDVEALALLEGLHGHAAAARARLLPKKQESKPAAAAALAAFDAGLLLRKDLHKLSAYKPIQPLDVVADEIGVPMEQLVKLDANENLYGPPEEVHAAMREADVRIYPDPGQTYFRKMLADYISGVVPNQLFTGTSHNPAVTADYIVGGSGSDDILDILIRLVDPATIVINSPTFGMYSFLGKINKARIIDLPRDAAFNIDLDALIATVRNESVPLVFLASPNNPSGNVLPNDDIVRLLSACPSTLVVMDEAYAEFSEQSALCLVGRHANLVVCRTFSKWAGLAGLRVGYSVQHPQLAGVMMGVKQPYNINCTADVGARASLQHSDKVLKTVRLIRAERDRMSQLLTKYSWLKPLPSQANFILVDVVGRSAALLAATLRFAGVLVRFWNTSRLQRYIRISAARPEDTDKLIKVLDSLDGVDELAAFRPHALLIASGVLSAASAGALQALKRLVPLALVSDQTEAACAESLSALSLSRELFATVVAGASASSPLSRINAALAQLRSKKVVFVASTLAEAEAARDAGVIAVAVPAAADSSLPDRPAFAEAGTVRVMASLDDYAAIAAAWRQ